MLDVGLGHIDLAAGKSHSQPSALVKGTGHGQLAPHHACERTSHLCGVHLPGKQMKQGRIREGVEDAEAMLSEISKDYQKRGLTWTPGKRAFAERDFPREDRPIIHTPQRNGRWLLPIRDIKNGTVDRNAQEEIVTDDML